MKTEEKETKRNISKRVRLRLIVSLPIITTTFTLGSGFMALGLSTNTNLGALPIVGLILIFAVFACISGMMLARGITEPLKKVASFIENVIGEEGVEVTAPNEIRALLSLSEKGMASK